MKKHTLFLKTGLMLFSLFFGAGNLIIPPMVGKMAGNHLPKTLAAFFITAVVLPVLGVIAVSEAKGLKALGQRVDPVFATVFTVLIYLSIGPMLGIPRAGSLPFELVVAPDLPGSVNIQAARFLFTALFFGAAYGLSRTPGKLLERMGKILTPALLLLLAMFFLAFFLKDMPATKSATGLYAASPGIAGFLDGYNTMDAVAALNFGFVVCVALKDMGIQDNRAIASVTLKSGALSGSLLMSIYVILAQIGAKSAVLFPDTQNGAEILRNMAAYLLGAKGGYLLGGLFTLACLTTSVGLISSCAAYFTDLFHGKLSYRHFVSLWCALSFVLANAGLSRILTSSVRILSVIYPVSIALILMAVGEKRIKPGRGVYPSVIYTVLFLALFGKKVFPALPLMEENLGWALPGLLVYLLTTGLSKAPKRVPKALPHDLSDTE